MQTTATKLLLTIGLAVGAVGVLASQPAARPVEPPKQAEELRDCFNNPLPKGALARLGTVDFRHGWVYRGGSLTFTPDGKTLVSAGGHRICRWDVATGYALTRLGNGGQTEGANYVGLVTADGKIARLSIHNWTCTECDLESGKERSYRIERPLTEIAYTPPPDFMSPDGKTFAKLNSPGDITLWNAADGSITHTLEPTGGPYTALTFSPDSKTIVVSDEGQTIRLFDPATGKEQRTFGLLEGHVVGQMAVSPDGKWLVTCGGKKGKEKGWPIAPYDRFLRLWDLQKGTEVRTLDFPEDGGSRSLTFTPDSRTVVASLWGFKTGSAEAVRTWDVAGGKPGQAWANEPRIGVATAVSPDGKRLATMNASGVIRLWDMETGKEHKPLAASPAAVEAVCFRPDGKTLLTVGDDEGIVREWDATTGKLLDARRPRRRGFEWRLEPGGNLLTSAFTKPDDSAAGYTMLVQVEDLTTGKRLTEQEGSFQVLSADGKRMAVRVRGGRINVIDVASGKVIQTLTTKEDKSRPNAYFERPLAFTADNKSLIVAGDSVSVCDVATGERKTSLDLWKDVIREKPREVGLPFQQRIETVVQSADATKIAFVLFTEKDPPGEGEASVWVFRVTILEAATGKRLQQIDAKLQEGVGGLTFSPDGKVLAGCGSGTIRLWDIGTGKVRAQFEGHRGLIRSLAFSPDGKRLASASLDSTVLIWDCSR